MRTSATSKDKMNTGQTWAKHATKIDIAEISSQNLGRGFLLECQKDIS